MRALLLCAGIGKRLRPLTALLAKPAVPVLNEPLAGFALRRLAEAGVREVTVNLHHLPKTVREALGDGHRYGVTLRYVEEAVILGTGGAVRSLAAWLGEAGACVVANGDMVAEVDLAAAIAAHRASGAAATIAVEPLDPRPEFGAVWADARDRLVGFGTREPWTGARPFHFGGFHVLEPAFLEALPTSGSFCLHREGYLPFVRDGGDARVLPAARRVRDVGTMERYLALHEELLADPEAAGRLRGRALPAGGRDAATLLGAGVRVEAPALLEGVEVGADAVLGPGVVAGPGARIGRGARLARSVVWPGAAVMEAFAGDRFVGLPGGGR